MRLIDRYLKETITHRASDLHIASTEPLRLRIDGDLVRLGDDEPSAADVQAMIFEMLSESEQKKCLENKNLDKAYSVPGIGNFRVNVFFTKHGMAATIRAIPNSVPALETLGLPDTIPRLLESTQGGLILVTGPTGSGKSTTIASMIDYLKHRFPFHILTIEDPIEYVHESGMSLVNQREIGTSCKSFADALKYALREDPDVILVGEMRDLETIALALTAAETGHLVLATLHTRGAAQSIDRIIDSFPANQQAMVRTMLAESLKAVVSQQLIRRAQGSGRVAAYEVMIVNHAVMNLIREGKTFQIPSIMQTGRKDGMMLMDQSVRDLILNGLINEEELNSSAREMPMAIKRSMEIPSARPVPRIPTVPVGNPDTRPQRSPPPLKGLPPKKTG